jgi:putative peptidoglycan lipid II flippase
LTKPRGDVLGIIGQASSCDRHAQGKGCGGPDIRILFARGAFDLAAAEASAAIRAAYALGLAPALALRSLVAGFHGRGDTRTPLRLLITANLVNIALKFALATWLGAAGLALATSVGLALCAALLFRTGRMRGFLRGPSVRFSTILIASGVVSTPAIWWSRDLILDLMATFAPSGALLAAFLVVVMTATVFHANATILALRAGHSGP